MFRGTKKRRCIVIRPILGLSILASIATGCGKSPDGNSARLASTRAATCPVNQGFNLVKSKAAGPQPGEVPNPGFTTNPNARPGKHDFLPVVTTDSGEQIIGFPGGTTSDGRPIMATETEVTGIEGYPYKTFQGEQGNCAPRAWEAVTGHYNPYVESSLKGDEQAVYVGGKTFVPQPQNAKPQVGQVLGYHPFTDRPGSHAAIVTGYDKDGNVIVATGWQSQPYQTVPNSQIIVSYQEVTGH